MIFDVFGNGVCIFGVAKLVLFSEIIFFVKLSFLLQTENQYGGEVENFTFSKTQY